MKDKTPFYNVANMFFVGSIFSILVAITFGDKIIIKPEYINIVKEWSILTSAISIILMYEFGFIINRTGSLVIEPILEKTKIWPREKYGIDVSEISETNSKFQAMITEINLMRSHILLYSVFAIISLFLCKWLMFFIFIIIVGIFILGGRKHNNKINEIRKEYAESKEFEKEMHALMTYNGEA